MPPEPIFELSRIDQSKVSVDKKGVYEVNPHRFEFEQLDGIYFIDHDDGTMAAYKDVSEEEFWVRGHIPGRPLLPGVLMIESAAQMVSYYATVRMPDKGFMGFSAVDGVKFRGSVQPGDRLVLIGRMVELGKRRCSAETQGYVDGKMVFQGRIEGMWLG